MVAERSNFEIMNKVLVLDPFGPNENSESEEFRTF